MATPAIRHPRAPDPDTPTSVEERLAAVRDAVASVRLEGLEPDDETVAAMEQVARGERTIEEVLAGIRDRIARGEI